MINVKLVQTLKPDVDIDFDDIISFRTESYIGTWDYNSERFVVFTPVSFEFYLNFLPEGISSLDELDKEVYKIAEEHVQSVSFSNEYDFSIKDY